MLDSQDRRTYVGSMVGRERGARGALWLIASTASETTAQSAYVAFACGIVVWGWQLLAFYTGFVTGPNKSACAPGFERRCRASSQAVGASLYHELAAILGAVALLALTHGQPNRVALWTYLILWLMHSSAKLNLFLGVPNLGAEMLPDHLAYLTSFMARRPMNDLFPVSVTAGNCRLRAALRRGAPARRRRLRGRRLRDARFADGAGGGRALVPGGPDRRQRAVARLPPQTGRRAARRRRTGSSARSRRSCAGEARQELGLGGASARDPPRVCDARDIERLLERSPPDASARSIACTASCARRRTGFVSN